MLPTSAGSSSLIFSGHKTAEYGSATALCGALRPCRAGTARQGGTLALGAWAPRVVGRPERDRRAAAATEPAGRVAERVSGRGVAEVEQGRHPPLPPLRVHGSLVQVVRVGLAEPVAALLRRGEASVLVQGEDISYPGSFGAILSGPLNASYVIAVNQNVLAGWPALVVAPVSLPLNDFGMTVGWVADSFKAAYNGGTVKTRAGTQEAAFSSAYIGRSATTDVFARGWYYQLAIWPFCMADADLQAKAVAYA